MPESKRQSFVRVIKQTIVALIKADRYMRFLVNYCGSGSYFKRLLKIRKEIEKTTKSMELFLDDINQIKSGYIDYIRNNKFKS